MFWPLPAAFCLVLCAASLHSQTTVALPFANLSGERSYDWIGESIAENAIDALYAEGIMVLDRVDRAAAYQRLSLQPNVPLSRASIVKVGSELDATHVLYGSYKVTKAALPAAEGKPSIRIAARMLNLRQLRQSQEFVEEGLLEDLAQLQNRIAWRALTTIVERPAAASAAFLSRRPSIRVDAMENYVRGLLATDDLTRHRLFTQAARLDPNFSQPSFQLGLFYWDREEYQQAAEWFQKVSERDSHRMEAMFYLGICRHYLADYAKAESAFRIVADAVPLNEVYSNLGLSQLKQGKMIEAVANLERALEGDAADPDYHFNLGYTLWHMHRFDEGVERFRAVLERSPDDADATSLLGLCLKKQPPKPGDPKYGSLERVKEEYEETVFRQLKSMLKKQ
jgi:tetratricopeptide (TPR) repeat protein